MYVGECLHAMWNIKNTDNTLKGLLKGQITKRILETGNAYFTSYQRFDLLRVRPEVSPKRHRKQPILRDKNQDLSLFGGAGGQTYTLGQL